MTPRNTVKKTNILRATSRLIAPAVVGVIQESRLYLSINGAFYASLDCAGIHLEELAVGFLKSEQIISSAQEILKTEIDPDHHRVNIILKKKKSIPRTLKTIASSGARGKILLEKIDRPVSPDGGKIKPAVVLSFMHHLLTHSRLHNQTGGTHCSALALSGKIIALREDIGRHNTIDMLGGYALLKNLNLAEAAILTTGRISSEIVYKVWNLGVRIIISHSAPTAKAIELSRKAGITLIGYVRDGKMNIYSHERRVTI